MNQSPDATSGWDSTTILLLADALPRNEYLVVLSRLRAICAIQPAFKIAEWTLSSRAPARCTAAVLAMGDGNRSPLVFAKTLSAHRARLESGCPIAIIQLEIEESTAELALRYADDYIAGHQLAAPRLARARLDAMLRRRSAMTVTPSAVDRAALGTLTIDEFKIFPSRFEAYRGSQRLELTTLEFRLLALFASRPGTVLSPEEIRNELDEHARSGQELSLKTHIYKLRQKIGDIDQRRIQTVRGAGYRLVQTDSGVQ